MYDITDIQITDTGAEPLTLEQAKEWLRVTSEDEDTLIAALIPVARRKIEAFTGWSLVAKEIAVEVSVKGNSRRFRFPYPKLDPEETLTVEIWNNTEYEETTDYKINGQFIYLPTQAVYRISYTTTPLTDPGVLHDLKRVILWLFENRGDAEANLPEGLMSNAKDYKILSWE